MGAKIKCLKCGDIIESKHRHDFVSCSCGTCAVDGGDEYLRIIGDFDAMRIIREDGTEEEIIKRSGGQHEF